MADGSDVIRRARPEDLASLPAVEVAADSLFRTVGMDDVADDEPPAAERFAAFHRAGRAWVAVDAADSPVAFALVEVVDRAAHVAQVSVHPDRARRGLGRALLDTISKWARGQGLSALTLTTFRDPPWNAPYYERLGFRVLSEDETTEGLRRVVAREAEAGLAAWPRVTMGRSI